MLIIMDLILIIKYIKQITEINSTTYTPISNLLKNPKGYIIKIISITEIGIVISIFLLETLAKNAAIEATIKKIII